MRLGPRSVADLWRGLEGRVGRDSKLVVLRGVFPGRRVRAARADSREIVDDIDKNEL